MKANGLVLSVSCFIVAYNCVFGDNMTVKEGDLVILKTDSKKKPDESVLWYFEETRLALVNKDQSTSCKYDGEDGRFKERLQVDYETAYLTITDIRLEHSGLYEAEIIRSQSSGKMQSLNRNHATCDSTKLIKKNDLGHTIKKVRLNVEEESYDTEKEKNKTKEESYPIGIILGIVGTFVVLLLAVFGVIYYHRIYRNAATDKNKPGGLLEDQKKDDSDVSYDNRFNLQID